jgi:hypothetical protein
MGDVWRVTCDVIPMGVNGDVAATSVVAGGTMPPHAQRQYRATSIDVDIVSAFGIYHLALSFAARREIAC